MRRGHELVPAELFTLGTGLMPGPLPVVGSKPAGGDALRTTKWCPPGRVIDPPRSRRSRTDTVATTQPLTRPAAAGESVGGGEGWTDAAGGGGSVAMTATEKDNEAINKPSLFIEDVSPFVSF